MDTHPPAPTPPPPTLPPPEPTPRDYARETAAAHVAQHGTVATARKMGVTPRTLLSWLARSCRQSTDDSMRARVALLAS